MGRRPSPPVILPSACRSKSLGSLNDVRENPMAPFGTIAPAAGSSFSTRTHPERRPKASRVVRRNAVAGVALAFCVSLCAIASAQQNSVETVAGGGSLPSIGAVNAILANPNDVAYFFLSSTLDRLFYRQNQDTPAELVAGNGFHGFGGDGGDARDASFDLGVSVGDIAWSLGNERLVYVADFYNNRVREIDRFTHTIRTV